jgi:FAD synthetase
MKKKVLVGGSFNAIHPGHVYFLKEAKKLGDELVVVLTHDKNNKKPYAISARGRKKLLKFLNIADKILVGDFRDKTKVIKKIRPDIIALGYDQKLPEGLVGFKVARIKKLGDYSTRAQK